MSKPQRPYGMDIEAFRQAGYQMVDRIADYFATLDQRPVWSQVSPGYLFDLVPPTAPETPEKWDAISKDIDRVILPGITHWQSPKFFAWFPANATFEGVLGDMLAATVSNPGFNWACSPAVTELEVRVVDWVARALGLSPAFYSKPEPEEIRPGYQGGGVIHGSASEVALTMTVVARERALTRLVQHHPEEATATLTSKLIMYVTSQTHSIGTKAGIILGLDVRTIPVYKRDNFALRGEALRHAIAEDEAKGKVPFMLIGTVGSTNTCAIDRLDEVAEVLQGHAMWLHVDSAFAGVSLSCPELRSLAHLDAINTRADSFSTNMHKWGLTQFDCSPVMVRRKADLTSALSVTPHYLRTKEADAGEVTDMRNMQLSLGRRFRSCKLWFILRSFGIQGLRHHIRRTIELATSFKNKVQLEDQLFEIVVPQSYSLLVFRLRAPSSCVTAAELDELNETYHKAVLAEHNKELAVTETIVPEIGRCIRLAVGSLETEEIHMQRAFELLKKTAESTLASWSSEQKTQ